MNIKLKTMETKKMTKQEKQNLLMLLNEALNNLSDGWWGDSSDDWGTSMKIAAVHAYNIGFVVSVDMDRHELMDFIFKNAKKLSYSEHWGTGVDYDCSGRCFGGSLTVKRLGHMAVITKKAYYDV